MKKLLHILLVALLGVMPMQAYVDVASNNQYDVADNDNEFPDTTEYQGDSIVVQDQSGQDVTVIYNSDDGLYYDMLGFPWAFWGGFWLGGARWWAAHGGYRGRGGHHGGKGQHKGSAKKGVSKKGAAKKSTAKKGTKTGATKRIGKASTARTTRARTTRARSVSPRAHAVHRGGGFGHGGRHGGFHGGGHGGGGHGRR